MGWFSVICIAIFAIICGRYAYKHESFDHLFGGKQFDRVISVVVLSGFVAMVFCAVGANDVDSQRKNNHAKYCKPIKNGYICKFPEEHERQDEDDRGSCNGLMGRYSDC